MEKLQMIYYHIMKIICFSDLFITQPQFICSNFALGEMHV